MPYLTLELTLCAHADVNFLETLLPGSAASAISDTVNQGLLKGLELSEELEAEFCKPAYLQKGVKYPTQCEVGTADQLAFLHQDSYFQSPLPHQDRYLVFLGGLHERLLPCA